MMLKKISLILGFVFLGTFCQIYSMNESGPMDTFKAYRILGVNPRLAVNRKTGIGIIIESYRNKVCTESSECHPKLKEACEFLTARTIVSNTFPNLKTTGDYSGVTKCVRTFYRFRRTIPWVNVYSYYHFSKYIHGDLADDEDEEPTFANKAIKTIAAATAVGFAGFGAWQLWKLRRIG